MIIKYFKCLILFVTSVFFCFSTSAQSAVDSTDGSMNSLMRSNDKIYVVMAVCITILIVLFLYLVRIDIKVSKKEKSALAGANQKFEK